jgi:hypothetical protein
LIIDPASLAEICTKLTFIPALNLVFRKKIDTVPRFIPEIKDLKKQNRKNSKKKFSGGGEALNF